MKQCIVLLLLSRHDILLQILTVVQLLKKDYLLWGVGVGEYFLFLTAGHDEP
jgi:hypothetical protein